MITFILYYFVWQVVFGLVFLAYMKTFPQFEKIPLKEFSRHDWRFLAFLSVVWPISICLMLYDVYDNRSFLRNKLRRMFNER